MKTRVRHLALFVLIGLFLCLPIAGHASSPPADSIHFCAFDDHERLRRDHPQPAAKRPADLNEGEPRTVRMIYFLPNDWPYRAEVVDSMKTVIKESQTFYREQMQAHGYGDWTFRIETDAQGEPLVHRVDGQHPFSHYDNTLGWAVMEELEQTFELNANIYFIVLGTDALRQGNGQPAGGVGRRRTKNGGYLVVPDQFGFFTVAHELGHTFGLYHDFRDNRYIMSYGFDQRGVLSACAAEFLSVHTYFNISVPIAEGEPPKVEIISSTRYEPGSTKVPVRLRVGDSEGLHQVGIIGTSKWCRGLTGENDAVVEYDYDGSYGQRGYAPLSDQAKHYLFVVAVDTDGNMSKNWFSLVEFSPYEIDTVSGPLDIITSVAFSPDGALLAYGSKAEATSTEARVMLWDLETRENTPILNTKWVTYVAFSRDGTLAAGDLDGVKLVDVASRKEIANFQGGRGLFVFSPDGTLLASRGGGRAIKIWNVSARKLLATLEGHTDQINALAFSPDGTLLASGSGNGELGDDSVRLWDVASRKEITTLDVPGFGVWSVAFSRDGTTLAWGAALGGVTLWDLGSQKEFATLQDGGPPVAFSPDGSTLFYDSGGGAITLWDVANETELTTLTGASPDVNSMSLSPDGTILASGSWRGGTITLWDVSEWTRPRPSALEIISGDGQQGAQGTVLAQPMVVEVRDQYGDPLPDAAVTFTITAGDGKLSGRFTVQHATTDGNGRAELNLTLGLPGPNTVGVSLGGRELATFTAEGVGTDVIDLEGDYRTWQLPTAATVRLGKGAIGEGDRAVALSADGRCLAVASAIGVWLYETSASRAMALLSTESPVHSVAFSLNGTLAAGLYNGRVELWDVETGTTIGTLEHGGWSGLTVVLSSDGTRLASRWRQEIKLWDVETRRLAGTWEVPTDVHWHGAGQSVAFSPDGSRLVSGFQDGTVRLWDVANQTEVVTLEGHTHWVISVSFSPDGVLLASTGGWEDPTVRLWDAATQTEVATLRGHTSEVRSVAFSSPEGATLASGSSDRTVKLWDVATQTEVATYKEHRDGVRSLAFSPDGVTLISGAADGAVLIRDLETGNVAGFSGHGSLSSMALSPDGTLLASGYGDGTIRLWDAATRVPIATFEGHTSRVGSVSFSFDGTLLASGSLDRTVRLWDVKTRELLKALEGHTGGVTSVTFSPDGALLASAGGWNDATVRLWDVGARELIGMLEGHTNEVRSLAFSYPDGALLASGGGSEDKTVKLWNVATRELIASLEDHTGSVSSVVFSPDGKTLASGSSDRMVRLWDTATRTPIYSLDNRSSVYSLAFSSDGAMLVSGTWGSVKLWDVETQEQIGDLQGHTSSVHSVAFSPDGGTLASGSRDGTMVLWDLQRVQLRPHTLTKVSDVEQQGPAGGILGDPFVVRVLDQNGAPVVGATVTFTVTAGGGTLSVTTATTDENGRAATTLTLGSQSGTNTVVATAADLEPVAFTATARAPSDFDGDGTVGFSDFVQFAAKFGLSQGDEGYDARYDLDGNGTIGFSDFVIFAQAFGKNISSS